MEQFEGVAMQRCVRYYRKSSGDDFATQEMRCEQYEARMGLSLDKSLGDSGIYQDANISGGRDDREGYNALLADIITGKLKGCHLIVRDQERLTRGESSRFEEIAYNAEKSGVRIFDATTGREIKDDLTSGVLAVIARQDRKRIAVLIGNNKELRALQGETPRSSNRRFGYAHHYAYIEWEEAKAWRRARRWLCAGWSLGRIVRELRERGIATTTGGAQLDVGRLKRLLGDYT
ncbi:recombinase family protein, partial [Actinokineospora inagensis]|uniref:recombinase family protein n=1 Tax=Actinokineospora inagensis TaxID=103730 RepID=UPI0012FB61DA